MSAYILLLDGEFSHPKTPAWQFMVGLGEFNPPATGRFRPMAVRSEALDRGPPGWIKKPAGSVDTLSTNRTKRLDAPAGDS